MPRVSLAAGASGNTGALTADTWFSKGFGDVYISTDSGGTGWFRPIPEEPGIVIASGQTVYYKNPSNKQAASFGYMEIG